jgi:gamma-polyglutamate biosynthesis protein CapA
MSFEFDKKFIAAALLFSLIILSGVAVFFFFSKGTEPVSLLDEAMKKEGMEVLEEGRFQVAEEPEKTVEIIFAGDLMLDRYIGTVVAKKGIGYVLGDLQLTLSGADFVVANLEGPITEYESKSVGSEMDSRENYIFTFPTESAQWLKQYNISIVNIGNNHIMNFGNDGLQQTRAALKKSDVKYFGDPGEPDYRWYVKEMHGKRIGLVSFNQFIAESEQKAIEDLSMAKGKSDVVIVFAHWGTEYEKSHSDFQQQVAHKLVDAGADLVIGSHPHVIQDVEEYQGKRIYYSLGNFIFDQYFEEGTKNGLLVRVLIDDKIEDFEEIGIVMETNGQTKLKK